jgi:HEAT repeat protein
VREVVESLESGSPEERRAAARRLAALAKEGACPTEALPQLLKAAGGRDRALRIAAATAVGWLAHRGEAATKSMLRSAIALLRDPVGMVRHDGAWILESLASRGIADRRALPRLVLNLRHRNPHTRAAAAYALATYAKSGLLPRATPPELEKMLGSGDAGCRQASALAIEEYRKRRDA